MSSSDPNEEEPQARSAPTWSEGDVPISSEKVVETEEIFKLKSERENQLALREAQNATRNHNMKMQVRVMIGVGLVFAFTLILLVVGLWLKLFPLEFATELMRMVIPTVLGAGLTIVGVFFRSSGGAGDV